MEFFDKLGKKASEAYKITADKTGKIAKETKMRLKMSELKSQVNDLYEEIGKKIYEKHTAKEELPKEEIEEICVQIDVLSDEIESLLKQCLDLRDKKQCQKCFTEIDKNVKFCPNCGAKQEEEAKEVEILEDVENTKVEEDDIDIPVNQDNTENKEESLEKTVEIESNVETNKEKSEEENNKDENNLEKTVEIESNIETNKEGNN